MMHLPQHTEKNKRKKEKRRKEKKGQQGKNTASPSPSPQLLNAYSLGCPKKAITECWQELGSTSAWQRCSCEKWAGAEGPDKSLRRDLCASVTHDYLPRVYHHRFNVVPQVQ